MVSDGEMEHYERRSMASGLLEADLRSEQMYNSFDDGVVGRDLLATTLDSSSLLIELENKLKGRIQVLDDVGRPVWKQITTPVMNEEGINAILQVLMMFLDRNQVLANLTDEMINQHMEELTILVYGAVAENRKKWGGDLSRLSLIIFGVLSTIKNQMTRARDRAEGRDVYGRTKAIEHFQRTSSDGSSMGLLGRRNKK